MNNYIADDVSECDFCDVKDCCMKCFYYEDCDLHKDKNVYIFKCAGCKDFEPKENV